MVTSAHQDSKREQWLKVLRHWFASIRQIIETVNDKLLNTFCLARECACPRLDRLSSSFRRQSGLAQLLYLVQSTLGKNSFSYSSA